MRKILVGRILMVVAAVLLVSGPVCAQSGEYTATSSLGVMGNLAIPVFGGLQVVVKPFVEGLAGVGVLNAPDYGTHKGFAWGVGAGVDVMALRWAGVRLQVDYFHTQLESGGPALSQVRFGIGLCLGSKVKAAGGWAPARLKATNINNAG